MDFIPFEIVEQRKSQYLLDNTLLRLYMEQSVAEHLDIEDNQRVTLFPTHLWQAKK